MSQTASVLAFIIGSMFIVAGGKAMRGWDPGYSVIAWLPVYNFVMGILTLIPAILIWVNHRYAMIAIIGTFSIHTIVLLLLLTIFRGQVATQSIAAMAFRVIAWVAILGMLWLRH